MRNRKHSCLDAIVHKSDTHALPTSTDKCPENPLPSDFGLFIVIFISSGAFVYYQLVEQLRLGNLFIWEKADWELINEIATLGLPMPAAIGVTLVLLLTAALIGITIGIFTRINATILFGLTAFTLIGPLHLSLSLNPQSLVLYLALFLALACGGAARVSLDYLLTRKKTEKK